MATPTNVLINRPIDLVMVGIHHDGQRVATSFWHVARSALDDIVAARGDWKKAHRALTAGPYVDINRLLVSPE